MILLTYVFTIVLTLLPVFFLLNSRAGYGILISGFVVSLIAYFVYKFALVRIDRYVDSFDEKHSRFSKTERTSYLMQWFIMTLITISHLYLLSHKLSHLIFRFLPFILIRSLLTQRLVNNKFLEFYTFPFLMFRLFISLFSFSRSLILSTRFSSNVSHFLSFYSFSPLESNYNCHTTGQASDLSYTTFSWTTKSFNIVSLFCCYLLFVVCFSFLFFLFFLFIFFQIQSFTKNEFESLEFFTRE